jgi:hypothetical protein
MLYVTFRPRHGREILLEYRTSRTGDVMSLRKLLLALLLCIPFMRAQAADVESAVRAADADYWLAYNACDMAAMSALLTDDVEFYHDKTGLTVSRKAVLDSLRKGPCGTPGMHLRREAVPGSVRFYPLAGGFAILSGEHRFYVSGTGKPEHLDGQADFIVVWQSVDGHWQMRRILSYSHGPASYAPPAAHLHLTPTALAAFAGHYRGEHAPDIMVGTEADGLVLTASPMTVHLRAASPTRFFALERDLQFDFAPAQNGRSPSLGVYENGKQVATATRVGQ